MINLIIALLFSAPNYDERIAVEAAYVAATYVAPDKKECCGRCKGGKITHGDGHVTDCPCPPGCACKTKSVLLKECKTCLPSK